MATQLYDENNVPYWVKDIKRVQPMIQSGKFFFEPQIKGQAAEAIEDEHELEEESIESPVEQEQTHRRGRRKQK